MSGRDEPEGHDPRNDLNDLTGREWVAFTKSWFVHRPPRRAPGELLHPAKFPETMVAEFVEFFTKRRAGHVILDPFLGTGSTLVAVDLCNRHHGGDRRGVGIELSERYAATARSRTSQRVICADALTVDFASLAPVHFAITSPPYWDVLHKDTGKLKKLRERQGLDSRYSDGDADLGNEHDYAAYLDKLVAVSRGVQRALAPGKFYVVILADTNKRERYYPIAFDFARLLEARTTFVLKGVRVWCQDDKRLLPYGYPYSFVPNFLHHYCLIFRNP